MCVVRQMYESPTFILPPNRTHFSQCLPTKQDAKYTAICGMSLVTGQPSRQERDGHLSDTGWFLKTKFKFRERPIRVKRPMSDVLIFRRKNSDVQFQCLVVPSW